tara:strand:+ start:5253 stop:6557 length:1305 start_codon:yes stop_codon:yes gene_type:complete
VKSILNVQYPYGGLLVSGEKTAETRKYPIPKSKIGQEVLIAETNRPDGEKTKIVGSVWFKGDEKVDSLQDFRDRYDEHKVPPGSTYDSPGKYLWHVHDNATQLDQPFDAPKRGIVWGTMPEGLLNYQGDDQDWTMTELEHLRSKGRMMPGLINPTYVGSELAGLISPGGSTYDHTLDPEWRKLREQSPANLRRFLTWDTLNNRPGTKMSKFATKDGIPKTLYHGAMGEWTDTGVRKDKLQERDHGWFGSGFYLTPNPDDATGYAEGDLIGDMFGENINVTSPNIIPVVANVQNPFDFDNLTRTDVRKINRVLKKYNAPLLPDGDEEYIPNRKGEEIYFDHHTEEIKQRLENASDHITSKLLRDKEVSRRDAMNYNMTNIFQEAGYDSAIANDGSEVIIYEPEQVKSMFNQGTWNPLTDDLHTNLGSYLDASSTT